MRRWLLALLVGFAFVSPSIAADCGDPVALKKTTTENHDAGIMVSRDTAILRPFKDKWNALLLRQVVGSELDVCVTVIARIDEDPRTATGGLQFWRSGQSVDDDFYAIRIDAAGNANIARSTAGEWRDVVKWGRTKLLKKGLNARNELRLVTSGDTARLYINGKLFKTIEREPGGKGGYGTAVMAEAGRRMVQFEFTDVRSSTQTDTPATPPEPSAEATPAVPADSAPKSAEAPAEVQPALDAEGLRLYDLLLVVPPLPDNTAFAKTRFIKAVGNPSPDAKSNHGSAQVTYILDPPAGGTVNRIEFFLYPDEAAAKAYMPNPENPFSKIRDVPNGSIYTRTAEPEGPFTDPIPYAFGYQTLERIAWTRWLYREGRVVMVAFTDETLPPLKEDGVTTDNISDGVLDQGYFLLQIAKFQLEAIKDMTIEKTTRPAPGAQEPLDAEAKAVFDHLLATPIDSGNLERLGTAFVAARSELSPKPAHGQAEIVYELKPPADGIETSLSFFFYPDEAAAARYMNLEEGYDYSVLADIPDGKMGRATIDPFGPFDRSLTVLDGSGTGAPTGWVRLPYRQGRVVIVALTGEAKSGDGLFKASEETLRRGALLLALGKLQLDEAEAAGAGAGAGTTEQRTGVEPTP